MHPFPLMLWCKRQMEGREYFLLRKHSSKAIISMFCDVFNGSNQETNKSYNREAKVVVGKRANLSSCVKTIRKKKIALHQLFALRRSRVGQSCVLQCSTITQNARILTGAAVVKQISWRAEFPLRVRRFFFCFFLNHVTFKLY